MVTAICLVKAEIDRIPEVAEIIAQMPAVTEVYSVTGDHDLVAIIRVRAHEELADVIPGGLNKVPGVTATQTHVAFRTYSRHDLESADERSFASPLTWDEQSCAAGTSGTLGDRQYARRIAQFTAERQLSEHRDLL